MLRITGGYLRGRKIETLKGDNTRPTLEKTREAIFSALEYRLNLADFQVYDLFAGSGALGFEAISRGIETCFFFETNAKAIQVLKANIKHLSTGADCTVHKVNCIAWLKKNTWSDQKALFLADPPYKSDFAQSVIEIISVGNPAPDHSILVVESEKDSKLKFPDRFHIIRDKTYGKTRIMIAEITSEEI